MDQDLGDVQDKLDDIAHLVRDVVRKLDQHKELLEKIRRDVSALDR